MASSAGCVTSASLLMNQKRPIFEQFSGGKEGEKSIGSHRQGEGGGESCEMAGNGQPELGVWQGRAEQRACVQPSGWGEGAWWYGGAIGLRAWQEGPEIGWDGRMAHKGLLG